MRSTSVSATGSTTSPAALTGRIGVAADATGVEAQQRKLNELFSGLGIPELAVDGDSGPLTRQQLCAARLALDLPISRADMAPGSDEEKVLMAATTLPIPANAAAGEDRWILVDKTCQVLFAGETGTRMMFVFGTSTGEAGWETSNQEAARAFRYDPALENAGWHNSTKFPVAADNPLNGNMYRPLYFYRGQAIHGVEQRSARAAEQGLRTVARRGSGHADRLARADRRVGADLEP